MQLNPLHLTVAKLLQGRLFRIPDYQRAYSWQRRQREDLFADIREAHRSGREHFMATLVALARERRIIHAEEFGVVELVDGQQRVSTLVILLKALEKALSDEKPDVRIKAELGALLVKGDEHNLVLLQTNHDSSDIFAEYVRTGKVKSGSVTTASDQNLVDAIADCERFVEEWRGSASVADLVFTVRNRLSVIYHELGDESTVYRVFEVLNSRGLDVRWIDKTKSQLMASIYEHVEDDGSRLEGLHEMQSVWKDIYRSLGLDERLGDEALRFAGTWARETQVNRILSDEDASVEIVRHAGSKLKTIVAAAIWLKTVVAKVIELNRDQRRAAVTRIAHARFLAIAIMLREFDDATEQRLLGAWERVTFRIFTLAGKDTRTKVGDYVRLGYEILANEPSAGSIETSLAELGDGFTIDEVIFEDSWDNWYEGWLEEVRYVLFRYEEHVACEEGVEINQSEWAKVWAVDPARSVEHIKPQSSGKDYVHNLGNLTMLPPRVNSSLKDKPPKDKAARYVQSGLRATIKVGRDIEEGLRWNRDAVLERAATIEAFVRKEWAD